MPCLMIGAQLSKAAAGPKVQLRIRLDWGVGMSEQIRDNPRVWVEPVEPLPCSDLLLARLGWATRRPPRPSEASLELRYLGKVGVYLDVSPALLRSCRRPNDHLVFRHSS